MTQPAVSVQLKQLENNVELPLFERIGKKLKLTQAGEIMLSSAERIDEEMASLNSALSELKDGLSGTLKIAAVTSAQYFLPHFLEPFHKKFPRVELSVKIRNRAEVLERLQHHEDDLVILSQIPNTLSLHKKKILSDTLHIITRYNKKLAPVKILADLQHSAWILREPGSGTRMVMERYFKKHHFQPTVVMELGSAEAVLAAVIAGMGISILPESAIKLALQTRQIQSIAVKEKFAPHWWYAAHGIERSLSPIAHNFLLGL